MRLLRFLVAPQTGVTFGTVHSWPTVPRQAARRSGAPAIVPDDGAVRQPPPLPLLISPAPLVLELQTWPELLDGLARQLSIVTAAPLAVRQSPLCTNWPLLTWIHWSARSLRHWKACTSVPELPLLVSSAQTTACARSLSDG